MTKNSTVRSTLALSILTAALTLAVPALAQTAPTQTAPADTMKTGGAMMKAAPTFVFSTQAGMNMMMSSAGVVDIAAVPGEKLVSRSVQGQAATLLYSGKNSASIFAFYDKAIKAEGWKTTAMDGKKMDDSMAAKPADTMAKPTDTMAVKPADTMAAKPSDSMAKPAADTASSAMMGGTHTATFAQGGHTIDLKVTDSAGRVTVSFRSK